MISPVFKPVGASTHQLAHTFGALYSTKATHTGTLDPIASGVVVVLTDEDRFQKSELAAVDKTYVCRVLLGYATDSHDILGLITDQNTPTEAEVDVWSNAVSLQKGTQEQVLPDFSARRWQGKSFFDYAQKKQAIPQVSEQITIHSIEVEDDEIIASKAIASDITKTISSVTGNFRQKEIMDQWNKELTKPNRLRILTLKITCTKRTYIRAVVRDISRQCHLPACILSLTRTQNGPYGIQDCICLI